MLLITRRSNIAKKEKIKQTTMRQITLKSDERNEAPPSSPLICPLPIIHWFQWVPGAITKGLNLPLRNSMLHSLIISSHIIGVIPLLRTCWRTGIMCSKNIMLLFLWSSAQVRQVFKFQTYICERTTFSIFCSELNQLSCEISLVSLMSYDVDING